MLQQVSKEQISHLPSEEPTSEVPPSLTVIDECQGFKTKGMAKRRGQGEGTPQQYSTRNGHLTPTTPKQEDMRDGSDSEPNLRGIS